MLKCGASEGWLNQQPETLNVFGQPFEPDPVNTGVGMGNTIQHATTGSHINDFIK